MNYCLPMIIATGTTEETKNIAYMMVFKYRKAYLTKEDAETISKQELDGILSSVSQIQDLMLKAIQIMESLKEYHYYPAPEYYPHWEKSGKLTYQHNHDYGSS